MSGNNLFNLDSQFLAAPPMSNMDQYGYSPSTALNNNVAEGFNSGIDLGNNDPGLWQNALDGKFGSLQGWGKALEGVGSVFGAYNAFQGNKLAGEQFDFQKDFANRNMANQASVLNNELRLRQKLRNQGASNPVAATQVNGAPIG